MTYIVDRLSAKKVSTLGRRTQGRARNLVPPYLTSLFASSPVHIAANAKRYATLSLTIKCCSRLWRGSRDQIVVGIEEEISKKYRRKFRESIKEEVRSQITLEESQAAKQEQKAAERSAIEREIQVEVSRMAREDMEANFEAAVPLSSTSFNASEPDFS